MREFAWYALLAFSAGFMFGIGMFAGAATMLVLLDKVLEKMT